MDLVKSPPSRVSARQLAWLEDQSRLWQDEGTIDPAARQRILGRYTAESAERRGMLALVFVGIAMGSIGLLLLIGYNWDQIPRAVKLALVIGSVAAAFGASAVSYAKEWLTAAETLALAGTLLFGNAIWLVAQVLHIQGRYPDAFLWWALGALACAWLVRSKWIGAVAAALVLVWVGAEAEFAAGGPAYVFFVLFPLVIAVAYGVRSPLMIRIAGPAAGLWVFINGMDNSKSAFWLGGIALVGCALYAAGRWHRAESLMRRAWEVSGLIVLGLVLIPLMVTQVHREMGPHNAVPPQVVVAIAGAVLAATALLRPARAAADKAVLAVTAAVTVWMVVSWSGVAGTGASMAVSATVLFSVLALVMAVGMIRTALTSSRIVDLAAGVMFALVFLIVRWTSVIENLLWSGLLLLFAGAGLLVVARLWRGRARIAQAGRLS
jgi:uncharacterized membrane protein